MNDDLAAVGAVARKLVIAEAHSAWPDLDVGPASTMGTLERAAG